MPSLPYNAAAIRAAQPIGGRRTKYSIETKPGLVLVVSQTPGSDRISRSWYVRYSVKKGRGRRQGYDLIGDFAHWSPAQAWERASEIIRQANSGEDPKATSTSPARSGGTVESVYREWVDRPARKRVLRPRSREEYDRLFRRHVQPYLGGVAIEDVTRGNVSETIAKVKASVLANNGARGLQATKAQALISSICEYALKVQYIDRNPVQGLDAPVPHANPNGRQHRPPTNEELRAIWIEAPKLMKPQILRVLRLAILLGKRVSELVGIERHEVMEDRRALHIPGTREGNKSHLQQVVPLPPLALSIMKEAMEASKPSPYVFQARTIAFQPMSRGAPSHEFKALRDTLKIAENVRLHDMRGLINDQMSALGVASEHRSHILHHTGDIRDSLVGSTYSTYDFLDEKRRALEMWEKRLLEIVGDKRP